MRRFNTTTGFPTPAAEKAHVLDLNELIIRNHASTYFFRASGDCPELGIGNNDILVVDRSLNPVEGDVAIVIKDNTLRLKEITSSDIASWVNENTKTTSTQEKSDLPQEWQEDFFGVVMWVIRKVKIKRIS